MTPDISKLNLDTAASLQEQKQAEARKPKKAAKSSAQEPLAAPQPTRVTPSTGMWNPDMGIRFGNNAPSQPKEPENKATKGAGKGGWDAEKPIKFGR
jgi:programmed cell death 6-interacting protein